MNETAVTESVPSIITKVELAIDLGTCTFVFGDRSVPGVELARLLGIADETAIEEKP